VDPARGRPALLLLIDDYDDLATRYGPAVKPLLHDLAQRAIRGRPRQLYLALAAAKQGFDTLPQPIVSGMSTKIALYMSNRDNLAALLGGRVPFVPDPVPGRGFVLTRSSLDEIQVATPVYGRTEADRLVALRAVIEERARRSG
jgi:DNA segregation ATPase FtsK/SpoIIIE-like protein